MITATITTLYIVVAFIAAIFAARILYKYLDDEFPTVPMGESDKIWASIFGGICGVIWPTSIIFYIVYRFAFPHTSVSLTKDDDK